MKKQRKAKRAKGYITVHTKYDTLAFLLESVRSLDARIGRLQYAVEALQTETLAQTIAELNRYIISLEGKLQPLISGPFDLSRIKVDEWGNTWLFDKQVDTWVNCGVQKK
jgi:DNA-binding LytR/AlgR family response regulator